jgi:hypothetical protein
LETKELERLHNIDIAATALDQIIQDHRTQQQMLEAERRLADHQVKGLQDAVSRQAAEIENLQKQPEEAKKQVQDIAVKAIEGASGARALAHINQIAMEQAKTRSPQG